MQAQLRPAMSVSVKPVILVKAELQNLIRPSGPDNNIPRETSPRTSNRARSALLAASKAVITPYLTFTLASPSTFKNSKENQKLRKSSKATTVEMSTIRSESGRAWLR
jgi:hypothetical protein